MKNIRIFLSENFPFLVVKFSIYLNRRVFVMAYLPTLLEELHYMGPRSDMYLQDPPHLSILVVSLASVA